MWEILRWLDAAAGQLGSPRKVFGKSFEGVDVFAFFFFRGRNIEWQGVLSSENVEAALWRILNLDLDELTSQLRPLNGRQPNVFATDLRIRCLKTHCATEAHCVCCFRS